MNRKNTWMMMLVGLNLLFFALLVFGTYSPPTARAQTGGKSGDFACVAAKSAGQSYDVLYVLDRSEKKLHAFYPTSVTQPKFAYGQFRDLDKDLGK